MFYRVEIFDIKILTLDTSNFFSYFTKKKFNFSWRFAGPTKTPTRRPPILLV